MADEKYAYEKRDEFNAEVADWAKRLQRAVRAAAGGVVRNDNRLSRSITARLRKQQGEVYNVGLKIAKEGVYVHVGASRGHGGMVGGKWRDSHGRVVHTNPASLGKADSGNRPAHEFLNSVIDAMLPELDDIAVKYLVGGHIQPDNVSVRIVM
jgi:hypothetical protein